MTRTLGIVVAVVAVGFVIVFAYYALRLGGTASW